MSANFDKKKIIKTNINHENFFSTNLSSQIIGLDEVCNYLNVGVMVFDANQRCAYMNLKAGKLLDQPFDEIIGLTMDQILRGHLGASVEEFLRKIDNSQDQLVQANCIPLKVTNNESIYVDLSFQQLKDMEGDLLGSVISIVDISPHQAKIRELEKSQGLLSGLLDNTTNVIYAKNLEGQNILINKQFEEIFNKKKEDVIGKMGLADILPQELIQKVRANDMRVVESGLVNNFEEEILQVDGTHSYLSTKFPLRDSHGEIIGIGGISTDITEIKHTEKLNESLNEIISYIHTSHDFDSIMQKILDESVKAIEADRAGITIIENNQWVMRYAYGGMRSWLGHSFAYEDSPLSIVAAQTKNIVAIENCLIDERTAKSVMTKLGVKSCLIFPLITRGETIGVLSYNYLKTKKFTQKEIDYISKLGSSVSLALDNAFHQDNLERLVEVRTNDLKKANTLLKQEIKERKRIEEELRSSEQRFATAFNSNPNLMTISKLHDGKYIEVNESFINATGYKLEEVLGKSSIELKLLTSKEIRKLIKMFKKYGEVSNHELKFRTKDGQIKDGLISIGIIELNGEKCLLSVTKDITERNRLVKEISRLDQLNLVGEMAAGIGHEIRNPMTTARGFLQVLGTKEECKNYKEYFDLIIEELDRANSIITEYLSMAKDKAVELKENDLNAIISAISTLIQADANVSEKGLEIQLTEIPHILVDEKEIRQLIFNLTRNGFEAMEPGGVLTISTYLKDNQVVLAVKDNGPGIDANIKEKLGTPFFTTKDNGTGLGLAVCYSVAARHGAKINIETGPEGSTFLVSFPLLKVN